MKEQVDLEVQETNIDLTNYKTLVYGDEIYPDYMINFEGTCVYNVKTMKGVAIYYNSNVLKFNARKNGVRTQLTIAKARYSTFRVEILKTYDLSNFKTLIYNGVIYDRYLISSDSATCVFDTQRLIFIDMCKSLKASKGATNYWMFSVAGEGGRNKILYAHIAVMWTFNGPPPACMINPTVDHIDGNGLNNDPSNLQWLSKGDNARKGQTQLDIKSVKKFCKDLKNQGVEYSVEELGDKYGIKFVIAKSIYYKQTWCAISSEFLPFPERPLRKKKQKVTINTLF